MQTLNYSNQCVVISGAASGIGKGLAQAFASQGADLVLLDRNAEALQVVARQLAEHSSAAANRIRSFCVDLADDAEVLRCADWLHADGMPVDVLINNAGMELPTPLIDDQPMANQRWQAQLDNNVVSMVRLTRALLPLLRDGGSVINQASIWGLSAVAGFSAYCASKHAVIGLTRSLAWELGSRRIRVNAVCPGWVGTDAAMASLRVMAQASGRSEEQELAQVLAGQVIPELLTPAQLAGTFLFLGSPLSQAITGQALVVSHGEVMH
ncbi:SDR family NAD(P)-dependent oxidoreductase [Halopseudomonas pelagia]|uniref:SDR family NAD(P)-dependent oxidoreductase n=1 Tax=Halopseudomonas pelagia TaxID=553151 RepID=UPI0003A75FED|nr:SDR family oxidoreductase [Halopseudomonas pelagia]|tara:strand:+ start:11695 stop:12495 length:801 start_codon:yes stop_codon:yes gene_type:complete